MTSKKQLNVRVDAAVHATVKRRSAEQGVREGDYLASLVLEDDSRRQADDAINYALHFGVSFHSMFVAVGDGLG
ncbi:hypothetical protein GCM10020000_87460 [Streptomyces olivoverticillatus]